MRTKAFGKLQFPVIIRGQGGGGGEYDMLQSTPVSQSAVSSAHKLASRNCGTAVGGGRRRIPRTMKPLIDSGPAAVVFHYSEMA